MSLTIDIVKRVALPTGSAVIADVTFSDSYPAGGEPLSTTTLGFPPLTWSLGLDFVHARQNGVASRIVEYDYEAGKLKLFTELGVEAAALSDQSAIVARVLALVDPIGVAS